MALPHCDALFVQYFGPWYRDLDQARRIYTATRPDIEQLTGSSKLLASDVSPLAPHSQAEAAERIRDMLNAAIKDWAGLLGVHGTPTIDWISAFDRHFRSRRIQRIIERSDPKEYDNDYLVLCCELGAVLGAVLGATDPGLAWLYDWPYWDSALYDRLTRSRINVFHCSEKDERVRGERWSRRH